MSEEISYVIITPYTIMKSRTGGIIARLLSRTDLELLGAQIIAPSKDLAESYAKCIKKSVSKRDKKSAELISEYIKDNFSPNKDGKLERSMILLFKGEDAVKKLSQVAGNLPKAASKEAFSGETIRDTYADLVINRDGVVTYFEPAVLTPQDAESAIEELKLLEDFISKESNIVKNIITENVETQKTLVIIKPDNWRHPSTKPGNIIDMLSRTGLRIVGCKIYQMSVADALEFYKPVQGVLRKKLAPIIGKKAKDLLEKEFHLKLNETDEKNLTEIIGIKYGDDQFHQIINFMSGQRPDECMVSEMNSPGLVKCMILIYEGPDAIAKIRNVLGPTDPTKAPGGTVRRDFGHDVMVNTAHASDAPESVIREMKIVNIENNPLSRIINDFLAKKGKA